MKWKDLKLKSSEELSELLKETNKKMTESTFYHMRARSKNVKELRELRRRRARILTLLGVKQS